MNWDNPDWDKIGSFLGDMGGYSAARSPGRIGPPVVRLGDQGAAAMAAGAQPRAFGPAPVSSLQSLADLLGDEQTRQGIVNIIDLATGRTREPIGQEQIDAAVSAKASPMIDAALQNAPRFKKWGF